MQIASVKQDTKVLKKEEFFKDDIHENTSEEDDFIAKIELSVKRINANNDLSILIDDFFFLISYIEKKDFVFTTDFILKVLSFLKDEQDTQEKQIVLKLLRLMTAFDSPMQQILINNHIFDILFKYFPNEEVIDTFSNLSCANSDARSYLLNSGIINFIFQYIDSIDHFECLIHLSQNLLCRMANFQYDNYIPQFIQLFHKIISLINKEIEFSPDLIVGAFRDYVDADDRLLDDFLINNQLEVFLNLYSRDYNFLRPLLRICETIIYQKKEDGAHYLINCNIIHFITEIIFNGDREIRVFSFNFLYLLVDYAPDITNNLISQDFHTILFSEFNDKLPIRYRTFIYKFCCLLLVNSSPQYLTELIKVGIVDMLVDYPSILIHERDWGILLDGIVKIVKFNGFEDSEIIQEKLKDIKENQEFIDWLYEACQSRKSDISELANMVESLLHDQALNCI